MYHHATPSPQHYPSRRRRGDRVQISRLTARHTRAVFTGHVHRIPSLRLITTTDSASRVRARATLYPRQPIPRSEPVHVPACVFRVTSAPAPSCMGSLASYTWQQLREVRPVKLDGGLGGAHTNPWQWCMSLPYWECVCGVTGCTADSSRVDTGGCVHSVAARLSWTPRETVAVAAKLPLHTCDLQGTLSTLSTCTAAAQQNTRPLLSTGPALLGVQLQEPLVSSKLC